MARRERSGTCVARGQTLERPGADPLDHLLPRPQLAPRVGAPGARPPLSGEVLDGPPGIADTDPGIAGETTMARQRRVVTPDGRVWHVRRRRAQRRPPWSRQPGQPAARFDAEQELPAEAGILPPSTACSPALATTSTTSASAASPAARRAARGTYDGGDARRRLPGRGHPGLGVPSTTSCRGSCRSSSRTPGRSSVSPPRWRC
jgi:hypothetical protein